ncbi:helix-turn-helix domain-containing protein [Pedobacter sandarakinus]|uniref:helix-turn-helix domain-containing protein n=1 Tax=Pedobacter sandarakinus TaxID=353156 RepID=UPI002247E46E|nr:AraC family transcriptional regulator [Pedobacter sandarakinus]MCX2574971.1 AraC family transcriptional regulator [Pedobacter sandarakinus]
MIELEVIKGTFKRERALRAKHAMRILVITKADGFLCMNSGDYPLKEGRIFFIPEEGLVRIEGEIESGYWLTFSSFLYAEFLMQHLDPQAKNLFLKLSYRDLEGQKLKKTYSLIAQLKKEIEAEKDAQFLAQYLSLFLGFTSNFDGYLAALTLDELQNVLRFKAILEHYFRKERSIQFYAEGMGMSPRRLNSFLDRVLGKSLTVLVKDRIMREAEELLLNSDYTVEEISNMLGFEQTTSFNSTFRRYKGISVLQFSNLG